MKAIKSLFGGSSKTKKSPRSSSNSLDVDESSLDGMASNANSGPPSQARSSTNMSSPLPAEVQRKEEVEVEELLNNVVSFSI